MYQFEMMGNGNPRNNATSNTKQWKLYSHVSVPLQLLFDISQVGK